MDSERLSRALGVSGAVTLLVAVGWWYSRIGAALLAVGLLLRLAQKR